jgi:2-polyprenyl-6-methoxyphenol hydroxylase-like FAD-dependent oxidoreductase
MSGAVERVAIIGGGIGGLSAALALRGRGIDAQVYERGPSLSRVQMGGGLHLWTNAMKAMGQLGMADRMREMGEVLEDTVYLSWQGRQLAHWPVGEIGRTAGVPDVGVSRKDMHAVLAEAVGVDALHFGCLLTDVREDASGVVARFADGREELVDALVGADGIRSTVRGQLLGSTPPRFAGYTQWQTITTEGADLLPRGKEYIIFGPAKRAVLHHVGGGALFWTAVVYGPEGGAEQREGRKARLLQQFQGWMEPLEAAIAATPEEEISGFDICDRPPLKTWGTGRVTLLGDAAHPLTTNLSQGACLAMEDGVVLGRCLASAGEVQSSLREYERLRLARTTPFVKRSWRIAGMGGWKLQPAMAARDTIMKLVLGGPGLKEHRAFAASDP